MFSKLLLLLFLSNALSVAGLIFGPEIRVDTHADPTTGGVDVVCLPSGRFIVVWEGKNSQAEYFRAWCSYSDDFGTSWSDVIPMSDENAVTPQYPRIVSDDADVLYAIWHDWRGPEPYAAYFSKSEDGGESWLAPNVRVSNVGEVALSPGIACNEDGSTLVAVFDRLNESRIYSSYSTDGGSSWSTDTPVGEITTQGQYYPVIEYVRDDSFVALWNDERDTATLLYCSVSEDGGKTWLSPNVPIPSGGHEIFDRRIDIDCDGEVLHAFWIESYTTADANVNEAYYSKSVDGGYTWLEAPVRVDDSGSNTQMQRGGIWARDSSNIFAVWCSMWNQSYPIYAVCSISSDSGKTWSDTLRANPLSGEASRCDIYGDISSGDILLAWSNLSTQYIMCSRGQDDSGVEQGTSAMEILVSRNPFTGTVSFTLTGYPFPESITVFDAVGRIVEVLPHYHSGDYLWTPSMNTTPGVYFVRGTIGKVEVSTRVVLL